MLYISIYIYVDVLYYCRILYCCVFLGKVEFRGISIEIETELLIGPTFF